MDFARAMARAAYLNRDFAKMLRTKYINRGGPDDIAEDVLKPFMSADIDVDGVKLPPNGGGLELHFEFADPSQPVCKGDTMAFQTQNNKTIYLCPAFLSAGQVKRAKTLVHEVVHNLGYNDNDEGECTALQVEVLVQLAAGHHPVESVYQQRCQAEYGTDDHIAEVYAAASEAAGRVIPAPGMTVVLNAKNPPSGKHKWLDLSRDGMDCVLSSPDVKGLIIRSVAQDYQGGEFPNTKYDLRFTNSSGQRVQMTCYTYGSLPLYMDDLRKLAYTRSVQSQR